MASHQDHQEALKRRHFNESRLFAALGMMLATLAAGCGHREVKAPCSPSDGATQAQVALAPPSAAMALIPIEDRRPSAPLAIGPLPVWDRGVDPCGPLKPLNGMTLERRTDQTNRSATASGARP
jgi:hypothetical protein